MYTMNNPEKMKDMYRDQLDSMMGFSRQWMKGVEQLTELNLRTTRDMMEQGSDMTRKMLSAREAQEVFNLQTVMFQPFSERSMAYTQNAYRIMSGVQSDVIKSAEEKTSQRVQAVQGYIDDMARNAPVGSESTVSMAKSATTAANSFYDTMQKMVRQTIENAERNFEAATSTAHDQARKATEMSSRYASEAQSAVKESAQTAEAQMATASRTAEATAKDASAQAQKAAEASKNAASSRK
ncbi:phasin family protein [Larsenimonas rhizosphaerae]|uniref:TIGR01841 family phasin n=1 Tax=Larsenimonas rhizosphaerae TaxID=2944682 RepID=A0AA41ZEA9_9GAMM|nr:TIGR01841 family phasin [Larsenimonas rhizosphaerae]MCM2131022.1 TIGR01841 family phasin [Larsenimonas rhizosphaerae]MCX2523727.1 TIGR01841 family phasin [Larsenimonas rhizosphaerae]